jgi:hypothetical protein
MQADDPALQQEGGEGQSEKALRCDEIGRTGWQIGYLEAVFGEPVDEGCETGGEHGAVRTQGRPAERQRPGCTGGEPGGDDGGGDGFGGVADQRKDDQ